MRYIPPTVPSVAMSMPAAAPIAVPIRSRRSMPTRLTRRAVTSGAEGCSEDGKRELNAELPCCKAQRAHEHERRTRRECHDRAEAEGRYRSYSPEIDDRAAAGR